MKLLIYILSFFVLNNFAFANNEEPSPSDVGVDEKLGEMVPMNITFSDEYGKPVNLGQLINGKPTVVSLVYYRCPGICSPIMNGMSEVIDRLDMEAGKDYNVVTISFDPREDYLMASEKKKNYLASFKNKQVDENTWRFLTGDSTNIAKICNALGWKYIKQGDDFAHGAAIMILSPEGKVVRYLYGVEYLPFDFKMALTEASEGRTGATISKLMKLCFSYDPEGRKYVLDFTRVSGGIVLLLMSVFVVYLVVKRKKSDSSNTSSNNESNNDSENKKV
ncbi:MAG TPA: SCO family protein [Bacteroidetes bacterium]|nr:SCO family protein [Bacteroidota bacterium]HCN37317.1 SCO family protein [Bacteroidota bacterium]